MIEITLIRNDRDYDIDAKNSCVDDDADDYGNCSI